MADPDEALAPTLTCENISVQLIDGVTQEGTPSQAAVVPETRPPHTTAPRPYSKPEPYNRDTALATTTLPIIGAVNFIRPLHLPQTVPTLLDTPEEHDPDRPGTGSEHNHLRDLALPTTPQLSSKQTPTPSTNTIDNPLTAPLLTF